MSENVVRSRRGKRTRARDRALARQQRRADVTERASGRGGEHAFFRKRFPSYDESNIIHRGLAWLFSSRSPVAKLTTVVAVATLIFFVGSYVLAGRIFPNVYATGLAIGELTPAQAENLILQQWNGGLVIDITVDGETLKKVRPDELGFSIDAAAMAQAAKGAGLSGVPFGVNIEPMVTVAHGRAQSLLLDLTADIYVRQYEAGYKWSGGRLLTVPGRRGRHLDISASLNQLKESAAAVVTFARFELRTIPLEPNVLDSSPFLDEALGFLRNDIKIRAYDPFRDEDLTFTVDQRVTAEWLTAGENGLSVREEAFDDFIESENVRLLAGGRYIDKLLATEDLQEALDTADPDIVLRLNYLPQTYNVVRRDTGYSIGRKRGIPFDLIRDANPTVQWGAMTVGDQIQIPSRDVMIPDDPIPNKRIIVDLESQWLIAFEDKNLRFSWPISSGRETAPTYPGIFQILTHDDIASGGSFALCNEAGTNCNHWEMAWFMGIYEVIPGLMNGFHGAVKLPNGGYLGGGGVYEPVTYGCIMSLNEYAEELYRWAEQGTMVEVISDEFAPESELARYAQELITTIDISWRPASA